MRRFPTLFTSLLLFATLGAISLGIGAQEATPKHLLAARNLVEHLDLNNTNYEHGQGNIVWTGTPESHTDCSGFIDHLLMHCYGYDRDAFNRWFDSRRPTAARYHDAIVEQRGFIQLQSVKELRPGDLIAVKYLTRMDNTGHIMLVAETPEHITAKKPIIENTEQWTVIVIDSSMSGHGPTDTRHKRGTDGKDHDGLGQGVFRLYTTKMGKVAGFAWSALGVSEFKAPEDEHAVFGRLIPSYQP